MFNEVFRESEYSFRLLALGMASITCMKMDSIKYCGLIYNTVLQSLETLLRPLVSHET